MLILPTKYHIRKLANIYEKSRNYELMLNLYAEEIKVNPEDNSPRQKLNEFALKRGFFLKDEDSIDKFRREQFYQQEIYKHHKVNNV